MTLATAESCTAGCLATLLADAPEASKVFHGGFVVYSKQQKMAVLGVSESLIASHTAVSGPVAMAMAQGVLDRCPADIALAVTGVAGPEPDEDDNPVGLMHVAAATRKGDARHMECRCGLKDRAGLRADAIRAALTLAQKCFG